MLIKAVIIKGSTYNHWEWFDINPGLVNLQAQVGGLIELLVLPVQECSVYINEEGKLLGLPANCISKCHLDYLAGNILILGPVDEEGKHTLDLKPETLEEIKKYIIPLFPEF